VMVNGISMEPGYHTGDLVIVRATRTYQVGDVVAYRDTKMGAYVIHRIIAIEQGQYILKGDNNSWIDAYRPTDDEIVGRQWVHAPKAGGAMLWLRTPLNLSLSIVLLGGVLTSGMTASGKKTKKHLSIQPGEMMINALYLPGFFFLAFLGLTIFAFTRPLTRPADDIPYQQGGIYSYSAAGTPGVYDTGTIQSGEPVFPGLTCNLNVELTYVVIGKQFQDVTGSLQMYMRIMDEQTGWQRTTPMLSRTTFSGDSYHARATLNLCQLIALINLMEEKTGLGTNLYSVEIVSNVTFTANAAGQVVADTFDPVLAFKFDKVRLYLTSTNAETDPLRTMRKDLANNSNTEANTLSLLGWKPTVGLLRVLALLGLGVSLGGLFVIGWSIFDASRQSKEALIRLRYGSMLVEACEHPLDVNLPTINIASIEGLARIAEQQNVMILHMSLDHIHYYLVQANGAIYRYMLDSGESKFSNAESVPEYIVRL
jgi:signal peptidase I